MAVIAGYQADLYMASGASVSFTNEVMTDSGDHTTYNAGVVAHRYWDDTSALTVQISTDGGATWNAPSAGTYSIRYCGGIITFTTANAARSVRVTGKYLVISQVGQAHEWEVSPSVNILDVTIFGDGWKDKTAGIHDATAKASHYFIDGTFFGMLGSRFVVVLYANFSGGTRFEAYAWLKTVPEKVGVDAVIDEELDFDIDGQMYYLAS
jgi:hypothetical protein